MTTALWILFSGLLSFAAGMYSERLITIRREHRYTGAIAWLSQTVQELIKDNMRLRSQLQEQDGEEWKRT